MDEVSGLRAHIMTLEDVNKALAQKLDQAQQENEILMREHNYFRMKCEAAELRLKDADLQLSDLKAVALRVYRKFGADTDWTEWRDLAEALGVAEKRNDDSPRFCPICNVKSYCHHKDA